MSFNVLPTHIIRKIFSYLSCADVEHVSHTFGDIANDHLEETLLLIKSRASELIKLVEKANRPEQYRFVYNELHRICLAAEVLSASRMMAKGCGEALDGVRRTLEEMEKCIVNGTHSVIDPERRNLKLISCLKRFTPKGCIGTNVIDLLDALKGSQYIIKVSYDLEENSCDITAQYALTHTNFLSYATTLPTSGMMYLMKNEAPTFVTFLTSFVFLHNILKTREDNYQVKLLGSNQSKAASREHFQRNYNDLKIEETYWNTEEHSLNRESNDFFCEVKCVCCSFDAPVKIKRRHKQLICDLMSVGLPAKTISSSIERATIVMDLKLPGKTKKHSVFEIRTECV